MHLTYNPVRRHQAIERLVTRRRPDGEEKKYYRFRPARWYGGIVTADCVGCGLLCRFCWVRYSVIRRPAETGSFYAPRQVAHELVAMAKRCRFRQLRISGGEPTIGKAHLLQLLDLLEDDGLSFILETNGIQIANDPSYAEDISKHDFVHVRVSLKGCNEKEFSLLTGAESDGFRLQLESLERLTRAGVTCHPSVMVSFSTERNLQALKQRLRAIDSGLAENVEIEELILYPHVVNRLRQYGLTCHSGNMPNKVPKEQI